MPTYDYECTHCGHIFEAYQQMSDKRIENCPKCDKKVKRLISSGAGVIFKGTGFYDTDYKKKSGSSSDNCPKPKDGCKSCPHAH
ncbi:MAG: zinc ribbon domain-containing protein [Candidatus Omnitrophica bacterium]|nr:zinc ribbon domain-containing protein [Candidatus Omnitrophota bacterium]